MSTRPFPAILCALLAGSALAAPDPATVKSLSTAYAAYLLAGTYRDYCQTQVPSSAADVRQAFSTWAQAQGVTHIETQLPGVLGPELMAKLKSVADQARPGFLAALQKLGSPERACGVYAQQLSSGPFDLKASVPGLGRLLASSGAADQAGGSGAPAPTPSGSAAGTVYSVAQLSTLAGTLVNAQRKLPGDQLTTLVTQKLSALGRPLVVSGTVDKEHGWLTQEDQRHTARWNVRCYDFADEDASLSAYKGKTVTVVGTLHDFDLSTFIELEQCRVLGSAAGLKKSSLPVSDAGWRYKNQPAETFYVAAGQGLKDSQILGVYAQQITSVGVGGMMIQTFEPYLFLKDGSVYSDPYWAPDSFNATRSRDLEPQKWGHWTRSGKNYQIKWGDGQTETFEPQFQGRPATKSTTLNGSFNHLSGGGNTALGGDVMVAVSSTFTFSPDGRFKGGSSASGSTSNVTALSEKNTAGRYSLSGYGLNLRYDDGTQKRLFYYGVDAKMIHIGGADFLK